jgi:hypothetical protein
VRPALSAPGKALAAHAKCKGHSRQGTVISSARETISQNTADGRITEAPEEASGPLYGAHVKDCDGLAVDRTPAS